MTTNVVNTPRTKNQLLVEAYVIRRDLSSRYPALRDGKIRFEWGRGMTSSAGRIYHSLVAANIKLSWVYFQKPENYEQFRLTVIHELAHFVRGVCRTDAEAHDAEWVRICKEMGGDGKQFHRMSAPPRKNRRWPVQCDKCHKIFQVTTARARKLERSKVAYLHSDCGGIIRLLKSTWSEE